MKTKTRASKKDELKSTKDAKIMKQPKLQFATQAKRQILKDPNANILSNDNQQIKLVEKNNNRPKLEETKPTERTEGAKHIKYISENKENEDSVQKQVDNKSKKKTVKDNKKNKEADELAENICEKSLDLCEDTNEVKKFSNSMNDAVKTECHICRWTNHLSSE